MENGQLLNLFSFSFVSIWLQECSPTMLVMLITPPPVDELGRKDYALYVNFSYEFNRCSSFIGLLELDTWA